MTPIIYSDNKMSMEGEEGKLCIHTKSTLLSCKHNIFIIIIIIIFVIITIILSAANIEGNSYTFLYNNKRNHNPNIGVVIYTQQSHTSSTN